MNTALLIVCYNSAKDTVNCLSSLIPSLIESDDVVLLYDNSNDHVEIAKLQSYLLSLSAAPVKSDGDEFTEYKITYNRVVYFKSKGNYGFAKANNYLLRYALMHLSDVVKWVWYLNNDTLVNKDDYAMISGFANNSKSGVLYSEIYTFENELESSGLHFVNLITSRSTNIPKKGYVPYVCGASMLVRLSADVPLWNEDYFLYYEDVDYYFTLISKGFVAEKVPGARIFHKVSASTKKVNKISSIKIRSQQIFMKKYAINYWLYCLIRIIYLVAHARINEMRLFIKQIER